MLNGVRIWKLRRFYEAIAELEGKLVDTDRGQMAIELRIDFTNASYRMLEDLYKRRGMRRAQIRQRRRAVVAGKPVSEGR